MWSLIAQPRQQVFLPRNLIAIFKLDYTSVGVVHTRQMGRFISEGDNLTRTPTIRFPQSLILPSNATERKARIDNLNSITNLDI
jgi:hypothetical protein